TFVTVGGRDWIRSCGGESDSFGCQTAGAGTRWYGLRLRSFGGGQTPLGVRHLARGRGGMGCGCVHLGGVRHLWVSDTWRGCAVVWAAVAFIWGVSDTFGCQTPGAGVRWYGDRKSTRLNSS